MLHALSDEKHHNYKPKTDQQQRQPDKSGLFDIDHARLRIITTPQIVETITPSVIAVKIGKAEQSSHAQQYRQDKVENHGHDEQGFKAINQRPLNKVPKIPRTIRRPVVPFSSLITTELIASPQLASLRVLREVERPTRAPE